MDRTVPKTGTEEIQLYMRTYYSLLRSTDAIQIESLVESHMAMNSTLHVKARDTEPDVPALIYSSLRLPACITSVKTVVVAQIEKSFIDNDYGDVSRWARVGAPGRRRRVHFNGIDTLAVFIASRSDIDDLVPILTAYQIEWNKMHALLQTGQLTHFLAENQGRVTPLEKWERKLVAQVLKVESADVKRLQVVWGDDFIATLTLMANERKNIALRLISSSLVDYRRATAKWWREMRDGALTFGVDPEERPVYFVSSNTHSLVNLLSGFARREEQNLLNYLEQCNEDGLLAEYREVQRGDGNKSLENFLYYVLKKYLSENGLQAHEEIAANERAVGVYNLPSQRGFEIDVQIMEISKLQTDAMDSRLTSAQWDAELLSQSNALILNIDYPLGLAAYEILIRIAEHVGNLLGVYVMGKAATLNGRVGDVMIPNVIHDEHSENTYLFNNCFSAADVVPYMTFGTVLDNQKAISAPGTFLQNSQYMSLFYHEGYTDIEMEGGPYLSAVYEAFRPKRHPVNQIVNLYHVPFDVGFLHYASDKPLSKGENLGAGSLGYEGIAPTYATSIAILRQILSHETQRLRGKTPHLTPVAVG